MTSSANDNAHMAVGVDVSQRFEPLARSGGAEPGRAFDWAEELTARPRSFAPSARFYGDDPLIAALWWAAKRHARPECFLGDDEHLVCDMRPRYDRSGRLFLSGAQLNAFLAHLNARSDGDLLSLVYLRPHPDQPDRSVLQAAIDAIGRSARETT
ncbi:MAG: hypothetical protein AAFW46_09485 [Pseudomonadota bacterium]